jgi:lactoylglutathione lyase
MQSCSINHVSVHAKDLEESVRFYEELFGMERIPTPNFAFPVQWMRAGDLQFHLFVRDDVPAPQYHHVALNVSDFDAIFRRAEQDELHDTLAFFSRMYELPDGSVQMYVRDPAGNLIECDWPDVNTLPPELRVGLEKLGDTVPQTGDALHSTLYLTRD